MIPGVRRTVERTHRLLLIRNTLRSGSLLALSTIDDTPSDGDLSMSRHSLLHALTAMCRAALDTIWVPQCPICGGYVNALGDLCPEETLPPGGILPRGLVAVSESRPPLDIPVVYGLDLRGPVRQLVHNFKYRGLASAREALARTVVSVIEGAEARRLLRGSIPVDAVIVPIPTHPVRVRERGWDHTWELARSVARQLHCRVVPALCRRKWTPSLTALGEGERRRAVAGCMRLGRRPERVRGRLVILVDDVFTTGVTLSTGVEALRPAEPRGVLGAVAVRTPRHGGT
jgi:predicted amidophosphoribosyltransferase